MFSALSGVKAKQQFLFLHPTKTELFLKKPSSIQVFVKWLPPKSPNQNLTWELGHPTTLPNVIPRHSEIASPANLSYYLSLLSDKREHDCP